MKEWRIPVYFEMGGSIRIEADTLEEAIQKAEETWNELPLPDDREYIEDSLRLDFDRSDEFDLELVRNVWNDGQEDEVQA